MRAKPVVLPGHCSKRVSGTSGQKLCIRSLHTDDISKEDGLSSFLDSIQTLEKPWDAILVQEGPKSETKTLWEVDGAHVWCVAACGLRPRSAAVLVN